MTPSMRKELNRGMKALAEGDREAFSRVFHLAWPVVKQYAHKMLQNSSDAEDVAQEALLKVFKQASSFDRTKDALTWLLTITTYECLSARKKVVRRREDFQEEAAMSLTTNDDNPEEQAFKQSLRRAVADTLQDLNEREQEAILAAIYDHERPENIAPATFRKRLERSLVKFRSVWEVKYDY